MQNFVKGSVQGFFSETNMSEGATKDVFHASNYLFKVYLYVRICSMTCYSRIHIKPKNRMALITIFVI